MVQVVVDSGQGFDAAVYGEPDPSIFNYMARHAARATQFFTDTARNMFDSAHNLFRRIDYSEALRVARAVQRGMCNLWQPDVVSHYTNIGQLQHAGLTMQRWLMAEPTTRELYHRQGCDGYSGSYIDMHPGMVGEMHYDYRRVMDGVVQSDEKGWHATTYMDELLEGDVELLPEQQADILRSWELLRKKIEEKGEDPTSRYNDSL